MLKRLLIILIITYFSPMSYAGSLYDFRIWDTAKGLPDNTVKCIVQDKYGFIWLGTFNGLCRFDGQRFTIFQQTRNEKMALPSNEISALAAVDGGIWVGTSHGLSFLSFRNNRFYECESRGKLLTGYVKSIVAANGRVFVLDTGGRLYKQLKGCSFEMLKSGEKWFSIAHFKGSLFWLHSSSGLYLMDLPRGNVVSSFKYPVVGSTEVIYYSRNQKLLYVGAGLEGTTSVFRVDGLNLKKIDIDAPEHIKSILDYGDATLFGTDTGGLIQLKDGSYSSFLPTNSTISSDAIFALFQDRQGNLLAGTYRGGLDVHSPLYNVFHTLTTDNGKLSQNVVTAVYKQGGKLFVGLDGGGLNVYDTQTGLTQCFNTRNSTLPGNNLLSITGDEKELWLGFYKKGLCSYDSFTGKFTPYPLPQGETHLWEIKDDGKGYVWVAGRNAYRFNKASFHYEEIKALHGVRVTGICFEKAFAWVSTNGHGIYKLDAKGNIVEQFTREYPGKEGLLSDNVRFVFVDSHYRKWIVTDEPGVYILDERSIRHKWRRVGNGMSRQRIVSIEEEENGIYWLGTYNGLFRYDESSGAFVQFTKDDGLPSVQFNYNASFKDTSGTMYWGTTNGLAYFNPEAIRFPTSGIPVCFTDIQLTGSAEKGIDLFGDSANEVKLTHNQNFFTIGFSAPDITNADRIRYAYCLKGIDGSWREVSTPYAEYTSLPPGEYEFCVKATDASGRWGNRISTLHIIILPPWWKTWWAVSIWYLLGGAVVYLAFRVYLRELGIKHSLHIQKIEREADERINRSKMDFLVNIVHELRTPVFLISAPLEELVSSGKRIVQAPLSYVRSIYENALRLNKLIDRIIDFRKIESGALELQLKRFDAVAYCRDLSEEYARLCRQKRITFTYSPQVPFCPLTADPSKLDSILSNLVSNAFKYTPEGGTVQLSVAELGTNAVFSVKDNGIGIAPAHQEAIFTDFYQVNAADSPIPGDGIGLSFVKHLVELHGGTVTVKSDENKGSIFTFTIPLEGDNAVPSRSWQGLHTGGSASVSDNLQTSLPRSSEAVFGSPASPAAIHTILIVDDDGATQELLSNFLKDEFEVCLATNAKEALQIALEKLPDIIITELVQPQPDGISFVNQLKKNKLLSNIPVIVLTGDTSEETKLSIFQNGGVDAYLAKPVSLKYLYERIGYLLKRHEDRIRLSDNLNAMGKYNKEEQRFILRCREIIDDNLSSITVKSLAEKLGMSQSPLYKKIKELTGLTVIEFITNYRLMKAVQYFRDGETNIGSVSVKCGFNDPKNFREVFKRKMQMTPREFIKSL